MRKVLFLFFSGIILVNSCSSGDDYNDVIPTEPDVDTLSLGVYVEDNKWIYGQMNLHYLWREDIPDSLSCNYLLDPVSFFKTLLSPRDRFSYCEHNPYYLKDTRSDNLYNRESVFCDSVFKYNGQIIGYLCYNSFDEKDALEPVMKRFYDAKITDLILDLRYNGGGLVSTCQYLCSCIAPENSYEKLLEYLKYNDVITKLRVTSGQDSVYSYYIKTPTDGESPLGIQSYGLRLSRLYVLTSSHTASASESTILCLKPYMDVITIGERTIGKGVGMETLSNKNCKYQLVPITFQYYNSKGESVPLNGIEPDYLVEGGLDVNLSNIGNKEEPLLSMALKLISQNAVN